MKKLSIGVLLGACIVLCGVFAYHYLFSHADQTRTWILVTFTGTVEISHDEEAWEPAEPHVRLTEHHRLRTGTDGEATLMRDESHVTVRAETEIVVSELEAEASRFQVTEGNVGIEARGTKITMRSPDSIRVDAVDAGVGMTVRDDGYVQVQVNRGAADLSSVGRTERVTEGNTSDAHAGRPPSRPKPIPKSLLLDVEFPDADTFNQRLTRVEGRVDPGSRVQVDGQFVTTDSDGRFATDVVLPEGAHRVVVTASDPLGRERSVSSSTLLVDVTAPRLTGVKIGRRDVSESGDGP